MKKSNIFLVLLIFLTVALLVSNIFGIILAPIHSIFNIVLLISIASVSFYYGQQKEKEKFGDTYYDYDVENPNALVSGQSVAGTVYASYPNQTPGLGWIL